MKNKFCEYKLKQNKAYAKERAKKRGKAPYSQHLLDNDEKHYWFDFSFIHKNKYFFVSVESILKQVFEQAEDYYEESFPLPSCSDFFSSANTIKNFKKVGSGGRKKIASYTMKNSDNDIEMIKRYYKLKKDTFYYVSRELFPLKVDLGVISKKWYNYGTYVVCRLPKLTLQESDIQEVMDIIVNNIKFDSVIVPFDLLKENYKLNYLPD